MLMSLWMQAYATVGLVFFFQGAEAWWGGDLEVDCPYLERVLSSVVWMALKSEYLRRLLYLLFLNGSTNNCLMFWVVSTDNKHALSLQNHFVLGWWFWSHSKYTHTFHIKKNCFIWCWTVKFINGSFSGTIPVKLMKTTWDKWFALKVLFCTKVIWIYSCSQHDWRVCGH